MDKYKILESDYNKDTKVSYVTICNQYGVFTGYAKIFKEEDSFESRFLGCDIACSKAQLKAEKTHLKKVNQEIKLYKDFFNSLNNYEKIIMEKRISKLLMQKNKEKENLLKDIEKLKNTPDLLYNQRKEGLKQLTDFKVFKERIKKMI